MVKLWGDQIMIITKEQRNAIALLMAASDRTKIGNFDLEDEQNARTILRAMIDSSGTVKPTGGFDLENGHRVAESMGTTWGSGTLRDALAEIERLRAENMELQGEVFGPDGIRANQACIIADQAASISELEIETTELKADLEQSERVIEARLEVIDQQAAKIRELEADVLQKSILCDSIAENCNGLRNRAWKAEGKIGPEADAKPREGLYGKYRISKADGSPVDPNADYFVLRLDTDPVARRAAREYSYMTVDRKLALDLQERITKYNPKMMDCINLQFFGVEKPRVWQITEERKAAIDKGMRVLAWVNSINPELEPDVCLEVLQAMLEEIKS